MFHRYLEMLGSALMKISRACQKLFEVTLIRAVSFKAIKSLRDISVAPISAKKGLSNWQSIKSTLFFANTLPQAIKANFEALGAV